MWIIPRPHYSISHLWSVIEENDFFLLLKTIPNDSFFGKLANLAVQASDSNPLVYRIVYKSKPQQILALSNNFDIIRDHWNLLLVEILPKILDCDDWDVRDKFIIPKVTGMASISEELEEDQNDEVSLTEFKKQFNIDEKLITYFSCSLWKGSIKPPAGKMFITQQKICYYTPQPSYRLLLPFKSITSIQKETSLGFLPSSIKITACIGPDDKTESKFVFHFILRDQAYDILEQLWKFTMEELSYLSSSESEYDDYLVDSPTLNNNNNNSPTLKSNNKTKNTLLIEKTNREYQRIFKLPSNEELLQVHNGWIVKVKSQIFGEVYISPSYICCRYKEFASTKKYTTVLHMSHIKSIEKTRPFLGISIFTDSIQIKTRSGREFIFRLFHCDDALKTMKTYWNIHAKQSKDVLLLENIGVDNYTQESSGRKLGKEELKNEEERFKYWDKYFKKHGSDSTMSITHGLRKLTHMGVPDVLRGHIWSFCSGSCFQWERDDGYYQSLLKDNAGKMTLAIEEIEKDVRRTFAHLPYFREQGGVDALRRVLTAYSWRNPVIGYCQGMNIVAGNMLLYMKEEAAFWMLTKISEEYLCDYYVREMIGSIVDQALFTDLCKLYVPEVYNHLMNIGLPVNILSLPWFMCLFISYIPFSVSNRVVDCIFLEGTNVLFQVGLAILKINKSRILEEKDSEVIVELLRNKEYNVDELIQVTFQDFDLAENEINELRNSHKFKEIKRKTNIKIDQR